LAAGLLVAGLLVAGLLVAGSPAAAAMRPASSVRDRTPSLR
jgi:hypothetical protein